MITDNPNLPKDIRHIVHSQLLQGGPTKPWIILEVTRQEAFTWRHTTPQISLRHFVQLFAIKQLMTSH